PTTDSPWRLKAESGPGAGTFAGEVTNVIAKSTTRPRWGAGASCASRRACCATAGRWRCWNGRSPKRPTLNRCCHWDNLHIMSNHPGPAPISNVLRRTIAQAVESGRTNYLALERETGVTRASIMRFVRGTQSLHLGMADRLAAYFKLEL